LGHAVRSAALAQAWVGAGGAAVLYTANRSGRLAEILAAAGVCHHVVPEALEPSGEDGARAFVRSFAAQGSWVSIDGYNVEPRAEMIVRAGTRRVVRIDDHVAGRTYAADVVVDQNLGAERRDPAVGCRETLAGTRFALLRDSFRSLPSPSSRSARLLVTLGGSPDDDTLAFAGAVLDQVDPELPVEVISARSLVTKHHHDWREWVADPCAAYRTATIALTTGGSTVWELCAAGVCPVVVSVADNQQPIGDALAATGAAEHVGPLRDASPTDAARRIAALFSSPQRRASLIASAGRLVDGLGAARVVARLRADLLDLRAATAADAHLLFEWANDPVVRAMSFSTQPISWSEHVEWVDRRLAKPDAFTYIAFLDGSAVGMVRFDKTDQRSAVIGVSVAAAQRGRKLAAPLIVAGCRAIVATTGVREVHALIRGENEASRRSFTLAGSDQIGVRSADGDDVESWRWVAQS
jgi:spore coat polysaccharide biosynthesis predicted glycosyltransferase SpsG/RimJ/RimL family protein N-acetyltransferase